MDADKKQQIREMENAVADIQALQRAFATPDGQTALRVIERLALHGQQAYIPSAPVEHTIFRNGCQQVALDIHRYLEMSTTEIEKQIETIQKGEEYKL